MTNLLNRFSGQPPAKPTNVSHSARRVNTLARALNAATYLEIGVLSGETLFSVEVAHMTGVDMQFGFDKTLVNQSNLSLVEETSDSFFSKLPKTADFDVIFIDGLHTFEQTYRDLCNSLLYSNRRTALLIDDVRPNDVYSTMPSWERACEVRQEVGNMNGAWHGDVFKVIFAIHDFHPALNYRTIVNAGNPQTLVWRSNQGWRQPRFNSFEKISRLTYFDLLDHMDILRGCSEEDALNLCLSEIGSEAS